MRVGAVLFAMRVSGSWLSFLQPDRQVLRRKTPSKARKNIMQEVRAARAGAGAQREKTPSSIKVKQGTSQGVREAIAEVGAQREKTPGVAAT